MGGGRGKEEEGSHIEALIGSTVRVYDTSACFRRGHDWDVKRGRISRMPLSRSRTIFSLGSWPLRRWLPCVLSLCLSLPSLPHTLASWFPIRVSVLLKTSPTVRDPCSCQGVSTFLASTRTRNGSFPPETSGKAR